MEKTDILEGGRGLVCDAIFRLVMLRTSGDICIVLATSLLITQILPGTHSNNIHARTGIIKDKLSASSTVTVWQETKHWHSRKHEVKVHSQQERWPIQKLQ